MPSGVPKDKKLAAFKKEISILERIISKEKDPKAKAYREFKLTQLKQQMARYLQDKPE